MPTAVICYTSFMEFKLGSQRREKSILNLFKPLPRFISLNQVNLPRQIKFLILLMVMLVLAACTTENSIDESSDTVTLPATVNSPTSKAIIQTEIPSPTEVENSSEEVAISLVQAKVRKTGGYNESETIEVYPETSVVTLPGLRLYVARVMIPDIPDDHCAVYGEEVWCFEEALRNIINQFGLGSDPGQLNDDEWLALISFFYATPLAGPDDLEMIDKYLPVTERAEISAPILNRLESGGIKISFYFESASYMDGPSGPMALNILDMTVTDKNETHFAYHETWNNYNSEE